MLYIYRNKLKQDSHLYNIIHIQDYIIILIILKAFSGFGSCKTVLIVL